MVKVEYKNKMFEVDEKTKIMDFLLEKDPVFLKQACCAKLDDNVVDLRDCFEKDSVLKVLTFDDEVGKKAFWHTTAHILAQAVSRIFLDSKFGTGPSIENGFYYDMKTKPKITLQDFEKIEKEMQKIVEEDLPITREIISYEEAKDMFEKTGQTYKLELLKGLKDKNSPISIYKQGEFFDLCAGPHLISTSAVKSFKLLNLTGAYWKADQNNEMLDRVYGISFLEKEQLDEYLDLQQKAKEVDHRKLGKELRLFAFSDHGLGFPFFLPNGVIVKNSLIEYWRKEHEKAGYEEIMTPIILSKNLWEISGHWEHYKENMYITKIDEEDFAIKPMNCPGSILVYKTAIHSYKELPLRYSELGIVHRHELSGALHGLLRVRCFTQDDAHIFLAKDQIKSEVKNIIDLVDKFYKKFGFSYSLELATMPKDHIGEEKDWDKATNALKEAMTENGLSFKINEGDGAFYGPKIDFYLRDCLNRRWQCGTIQLDFQLPERFEMEYIGKDGQKHMPIMIHRVVYGSIERFIGILTEHFAGAFPFFMAPLQVEILPVSDKFSKYACEVEAKLKEEGFRAKANCISEKLGYRLRQAQLNKIPYIIVVGEEEENSGLVSVRKHKNDDIIKMSMKELVEELKDLLK